MKYIPTFKSHFVFLIIAPFALMAIGACSSSDPADVDTVVENSRAPTPTPIVTSQNGITRVVIYLSPTDGEGQIGTAIFVSDASTTTIEVLLEPASIEAQPIHIHSGVCTDVGAVIFALQNVVKGSSVTVIDLPLDEVLKDGTLVNVHASYSDASNYTACGQLPEQLP